MLKQEVTRITRGRRLGEARDGILVLDPQSAAIVETSPFLTEILGYTRDELLGRPLRETGLFGGAAAAETLLEEVLRAGYFRCDVLLASAHDGRLILVDLVGSSYRVDDRTVIQFNVGSVGERE